MNNVSVFQSVEFGSVRTKEQNGEALFVGADVAKALGYTNPSKAITDHCKGGNESLVPSNGGEQTTKIIPERDVYRLIMRSKLPTAEKFEVLLELFSPLSVKTVGILPIKKT